MTKVVHDIYLLPHQKMFLESDKKNLWMACSLGAGKTHVAVYYIIKRMLQDPEGFGLIMASVYKQLNNSILSQLFTTLTQLGISYRYNSLTGILFLPSVGARALCASAESYEVLRGIEFSWALLDEVCLYSKDAYDVIIGRIRQKSKLPLQIRSLSTPRGFNWTYDVYADGLGEIPFGEITHKDEYTAILRARSTDNFFLPEGYLELLAMQYDSRTYSQEVLGEFVAGISGQVYPVFRRQKHTKAGITDDGVSTVYVGMDFNVAWFSATLANVVQNADGTKVIKVFDEIWLENSNTYEMAQEIKRRYPDRHIVVCPDATGGARKTSSQKTDHQILRDAGFDVKVRNRNNPHKVDRYNTVNRRLDMDQIRINSSCNYLIRDLEQLEHEKNPPHLSHSSDGLGYLAWYLIPIQRDNGGTKTIRL